MRAILVLLCILVSTGCASRWYQEPPASELSATLTMHRTSDGVSFMAFDNPQCTRTEGMGFMHAFSGLTAQTKSDRLRPGRRIFIFADSARFVGAQSLGSSGAMQAEFAGCHNLVSFIPVASHEYLISHVFEGGVCRADLIDAETHKPPESLQSHPVPQGCGE